MTDGAPKRGPGSGSPRYSWKAVTALVLAVGALLMPAIVALVLAAAGLVLGLVARRELKREPSLTGGALALAAVIVAAFVLVFDVILLTLPAPAG
ncbi:hypothetical protein [Agromyces albus]|uniref:hypothetical protein n=1 Tax=Agromyces albus TaxID=205332 RepID=UPI0027891C4B|nr:hypothetical protein [Agromyces albus]MDQ0575844.1 hypothetical protein [Agromyces albus]